ncbi:uncharacterized protein MYCFIDRAFT_183545 [Pseudocercospora fijiensis CIRAD86]|uniref:Uncharacterized protein n=1 Tax=Pseudocercospora fijiensis (strain CIRAD86) TaxID=383855 RepID=M3ATC6_PSEFD|nr:uncharacterized protein MYCFIDRAFT_183545 [Pseudocercospora fijiensis CIRAD86]EME80393.1 hypothetical protein MYCFIDRAFT_183545 [Pseudocercospora fijiensis CIRAD86]
MTVGKMTLVVGASPGSEQDESNKQAVSNQLSIPTFGAPMLGGSIESTKPVSYCESRDNAIAISRTGLQTPSAIVDTSYNPDQDIPSLGSWDLGEAYPVALILNGIGGGNGEHASSQVCPRSTEDPSSHAASDVPQDGKTALHIAAESGRLSTVQLLLRLNSNVLAQDSMGRTSLHLAVGNQQQSVVEELVKRPACLDVREKDGRTALHIAVTQGHDGIVGSLLGAGAMLEVKDARGQTPLHIAAANGQDAILQLLFVRGANINATM